MPPAVPLEQRITMLEMKSDAHDRMLRTINDEIGVHSSRIGKIEHEAPDALRASHHNIEVGIELRVEQLRVDMQRQIVDQKFLRKENRALALGLAGLLFIGWLVNRVEVNATTVVGLVSALLAAIALFWQQLQKGERKAKDSLVPPKP